MNDDEVTADGNWTVHWPDYLAGWINDLLTNDPPEYYDIALRDFGLLLGALTLARLAFAFRRTAALPARRGERQRPQLHRAA